jgi:type II secretory pathway pseudopilin PulG
MNRRRRVDDNRTRKDAGETLIEVLITMIILGGAIAALVGGISTTVLITSRHRDLATANSLLRSYAEAIKENARTGYQPCATTYTNLAGRYDQPTGWATPTNTVQAQGCPGTDQGLQHVTISVTTPKGVVQTLDLWIRRTTT